MKRFIVIIGTLLAMSATAKAEDFWTLYSQNLVYNYSVKTATIPDRVQFGQRLSNDQMLALLTRSFSITLGERLKSTARQRSPVAFICIFSGEPERCFADVVLGVTFDEVHFINAPKISNKFLKNLKSYYSYSLFGEKDALERRLHAANNVPRWKKFSPRFGFNLNEPEVILSSPFYTFLGIYVEPKYGTKNGAAVSLVLGRFFMDFQKEGLSIKYRLKQKTIGRGYLNVTVRPEGEIIIGNEFILK
jgi:hypothetical protein